MEYSAELFATDKYFSDDTKYNYELSGAFYDVYSDGEGDYHMAIEDRPSLEARIWFYDHFISKEGNYPIYDSRRGIIREQQGQNPVLQQVLGLPEEVMKVRDSKGNLTILLTPDEILHRVQFEPGLFKGYGDAEINYEILGSNQYAVIGCINHLIANGFFVQNPERIYHMDSLDEANYYPVYIDVDRIPKKYLLDEEGSDKLVFDFVDQPQQITRDDFVKYFKPIDKMTIQEKVEIAFSRTDKDGSIGNGKLRLALRRYFYAIIREIMNRFFLDQYQVRALFGHTVLYHDYHAYELKDRFIYCGVNFNMYSSDHRTILKENGRITTKFDTDYHLCKEDKTGLAYAFDLVHHYFERHPELSFIPSLYMKMMGLPYPAFEKARFFDFQKGDSRSFLKLFDLSYEDQYQLIGIFLPCATDFGIVLSEQTWKNYLPVYFRSLQKKQVFFSDPSILHLDPTSLLLDFRSLDVQEMGISFFFSTVGKCPALKKAEAGSASLYRSIVDLIEKGLLEEQADSKAIEEMRAFLLRDEVNGELKTLKSFFALLNQGYRSDEAYLQIDGKNKISYGALIVLIFTAVAFTTKKPLTQWLFQSRDNQRRGVLYNRRNLEFRDDSLKHPIVLKGRNFLAYSDEDKSCCYFDIKDKKAIENLIEIYNRYFKNKTYFSFNIHYEHDTFCADVMKQYTWNDFLNFLGLPSLAEKNLSSAKPLVEQLQFKANISIFNADHQAMIREDLTLRNLLLNREALRNGVYLLGFQEEAKPVYVLKEKIPAELKLSFDPLIIKSILTARRNEGLTVDFGREADRSLKLPLKEFAKKADPYLWSGKESEGKTGFGALMNDYTGKVVDAFAGTLRQQFFPKEKQVYSNLFFYPSKKGGYVAAGPSFFAFSDTGKITDFAIEAKDISLTVKTINAARKLYRSTNEEETSILTIAECGLPFVFAKRIYALLTKKKGPITSEDVMNALPVVETKRSTKELLSFSDHFHVRKPDFKNLFVSTQLFHELLEEGMMVYPGTRYLNDALRNMTNLSFGLKSATLRVMVEHTTLFTKDLKGTVKSVLIPDEISFAYTVDEFLNQYNQYGFSSEFLFYTKEALLYAHSKDSLFLVKAINARQGSMKLAEFDRYLYSLYQGFSIKPYSDHIPEDAFFSLVSLFLLYLEQQVTYLVGKKLRKHAK